MPLSVIILLSVLTGRGVLLGHPLDIYQWYNVLMRFCKYYAVWYVVYYILWFAFAENMG